jgi:hypothetical protein
VTLKSLNHKFPDVDSREGKIHHQVAAEEVMEMKLVAASLNWISQAGWAMVQKG